MLAGMSYFGLCLQRQIEDQNRRPSEVARASGLSPSVISRLVHGDQHTVDEKVFERLCATLKLKPAHKAERVAAYLRDHCLGHEELVEISIRGSTRARPAPRNLPRELEDAFDALEEEAILRPRLRHALVDLAAYVLNRKKKKTDDGRRA